MPEKATEARTRRMGSSSRTGTNGLTAATCSASNAEVTKLDFSASDAAGSAKASAAVPRVRAYTSTAQVQADRAR